MIGNTAAALRIVMDEFDKAGIETEQLNIYDDDFVLCNACLSCRLRGDGRCINENDRLNSYVDTIRKADAVILASPVYYGSISAQMKIFMERVGLINRYAGNALSRKVGAAIAVQSSHGGLMALSQMVNFLLSCQIVVCPSSDSMVLTAEAPSDLEKDVNNVKLLKDLVKEMVWLMSCLRN